MENASIKKTIEFVNELETLNTLNDEQIMDYAQWAGRLSSLGYETYLNIFCQRFDAQTVNALLKHRIHEGLEDIKEAYGEYLAVEIFTVQDFSCFVNHAPEGFIDQSAKDFMNFWIQTAELQSLNEEASQTLKAYLESYPIAEEDQLDIVAAPLTEKTLRFWDAVLEPLDKVIEMKSKKLEKQIHIEKVDGDSDNGQISIRISGVDPKDVVRVRQRFVPALRSKTDPSVWTFDFSAFGTTFNKQGDFVVHTYDGAKASVPYASIEKADSPSVDKVFLGVKLFKHNYATMAAADDDAEAPHLEFDVEGTNAALDIAIDQNDDRVIVNVYQKGNSDNLSDELNGWSFYDCNDSLLGVIQNAFAEFKCSQFDGCVVLKDANGNPYRLIINE
ncbi:MAG: hypothetical protein IJF84_09120 [Thermoguttaceae bacterium]|nr:hypothetical protein [Thermoguttaceae bacterium]